MQDPATGGNGDQRVGGSEVVHLLFFNQTDQWINCDSLLFQNMHMCDRTDKLRKLLPMRLKSLLVSWDRIKTNGLVRRPRVLLIIWRKIWKTKAGSA